MQERISEYKKNEENLASCVLIAQQFSPLNINHSNVHGGQYTILITKRRTKNKYNTSVCVTKFLPKKLFSCTM